MSRGPLHHPGATPEALSSDDELARAIWRVEEIAAPRGISPELTGKRIAVLGMGDSHASALQAVLETHGARVIRVPPAATRGVHDVAAPEGDIDWLRRLLLGRERPVDGIVDLGVGNLTLADASRLWPLQYRQTRDALMIVAPAWSDDVDMRRYFYAPVLQTGGDFGTMAPPRNPHGGLWAGLAKGLPPEIPTVNLRILDFPAFMQPRRFAERVAAELYRWGLYEVGWIDGKRYTLVARAEDVATPTLELTEHDTVLVTGGDRGLGFEVALDLSLRFGCAAVVTGTRALPAGEPELRMSEKQWRSRRVKLLADAERLGTVRGARRRVTRIDSDRALLGNLRRADEAGARISYEPCDVTRTADVDRVVARLGETLAVVVHNADLDLPSRLDAAAEGVVEVMVDGLINLLTAVDSHADPSVVSVVGSLAGRRGAPLGRLDQGAAAEAVSYVARWSSELVPVRTAVQTLAFPCLGNSEVVDARSGHGGENTVCSLSREETVHLWRRELLAATEGEVTFCDRLDHVTSPAQARGYSPRCELPGQSVLRSLVARSGEVVRFRAGHELTTRVDLAPPGDSVNLDLTVDDKPAVPVSVLVDQMASTASWLVTGESKIPVGLLCLDVELARLCDATRLLCYVSATHLGTSVDDDGGGKETRVAVEVMCGGDTIATGTVRFATAHALAGTSGTVWALPAVPERPRRCGTESGDATADPGLASAPEQGGVRLNWEGEAFDLADRCPDSSASCVNYRVGPDRLGDLFAPGLAVVPTFGYNLVESVAALSYAGRASSARGGNGLATNETRGVSGAENADGLPRVRRLTIDELTALRPTPQDQPCFLYLSSDEPEDEGHCPGVAPHPGSVFSWVAADLMQQPILRASGVRYTDAMSMGPTGGPWSVSSPPISPCAHSESGDA